MKFTNFISSNWKNSVCVKTKTTLTFKVEKTPDDRKQSERNLHISFLRIIFKREKKKKAVEIVY